MRQSSDPIYRVSLVARDYLRLIPVWQAAGYRVRLRFLKLPDPDFAIRRVEQRVRLGGHDIPHGTIRRRFARGWENLQQHYLGIVNEWAIYDSSRVPPALLESGDNLKSYWKIPLNPHPLPKPASRPGLRAIPISSGPPPP